MIHNNINMQPKLYLPRVILPARKSAKHRTYTDAQSSFLISLLVHCLFCFACLIYYDLNYKNQTPLKPVKHVTIDIIPIPQSEAELGTQSFTETMPERNNPLPVQSPSPSLSPQPEPNIIKPSQSIIQPTIKSGNEAIPPKHKKPTSYSRPQPSKPAKPEAKEKATRSYTQLLSILMNNNKVYPENIKIKQPVRILVKLSINVNGKLTSFDTMNKTGNPTLDKAIIKTVNSAATQFPPIPKENQLNDSPIQEFLVPIEFLP